MPIKRVQFPDGSIKRVEVPDGATDDQILEFVQSQYKPQAAPDFSSVKGAAASTEAAYSPTRRGLGIGARATIEGVAGVADFLASPVRAAFELFGSPQATYGDLAGRLGDRIGLPRPNSGSERVQSDVGRALAGTGATLGVGAALPAANRLGAFLTAQPGMQVAGAAAGASASGSVRESGGGVGSQIGAGLAGSLVPGVGLATGAAGVRGLVRGGQAGRAAMERRIRDFESLGATPSVGQATQSWPMQGVESLLAGGPTSSGVLSRFAEKQADQIGAGLQGKANAISPNASAERAGRAVEKGSELFKSNNSVMKRALYWQADNLVPPNTPVPMQNTWQEVVRMTTPNPGAAATTGAMVNTKIASLRKTLEQDLATGGGNITYDALRRIRTDIGEALDDFSLVSDTPTREFKALYAALSRDMETVAASQGPAAAAAAKRANNYTRASSERLETLSRIVDRSGGPEKVYSAIMAGTRDGGTTLRSVLQSLPQDGQKALTAAVIKRMGIANPGAQDAAGEVFSAATFLTNWNKVSPEARRALFDRYGPGFSNDIEKIGRVAQNIKEGSKVFANPSGTANRAAAIGYYTSLPAAAAASAFAPSVGMMPFAALVLSGLASNAGARLMTNPQFVKWLANSTKAPRGAAMASLQVMAQSDPDAADLYQSLLEQTGNRNDQSGRGR